MAWQDDKAARLAAQKRKRDRAEAAKQARQAAKKAAELARKEAHRKQAGRAREPVAADGHLV